MRLEKFSWIRSAGIAMLLLLFVAACGKGTSSQTSASNFEIKETKDMLLKVPVPEPFPNNFCARIRVSGSDFPSITMDKVYPPETTSIETVVPNIPAGENRTVELGLFANGSCADFSLADWFGSESGVVVNPSAATIVNIALQKLRESNTGAIIIRGGRNMVQRRLYGEVVQMDTTPIAAASCRILEGGVEIGTVASGSDIANIGVINTLVTVNTGAASLELICTHPLFTQAGQEFAQLVVDPNDSFFGAFAATVEMNASVATLPNFKVVGSVINQAAATKFQESLGLSYNPLSTDNAIRFVDARKYLALPAIQLGEEKPDEDGSATQRAALNFDAIRNLPVLSQDAALKKAQSALQASGLSPETAGGAMQTAIMMDHTMFEARDLEGRVMANREVDTQVRYVFSLNGLPLLGSGAKVNMVFNGDGSPTQAVYALRKVEKGEMMRLVSLSEGNSRALKAFRRIAAEKGAATGAVRFNSPQVVYYSPPMPFNASALYPHFLYTGTIMIGTEEVQLRNIMVPAIEAAPSVTLKVEIVGRSVMASAEITGGTPPYQFSWGSSSTELDPSAAGKGPGIQYVLNPKGPISSETVSIQIMDADGLTAEASETVPVMSTDMSKTAKLMRGGVVDFGTEWIGSCGGLGGSAGNAAGFVTEMQNAGFVKRFNWGNNAAWEQDFKDAVFAGGDDLDWADDADIVFYTGHANGDGFSFCDSTHTDTFLHYNDARWGNFGQDLEWLVVAACGPLQGTSSGLQWWQRWGPAFDGLHLMLAYATTSYDNDDEGRLMAEWMLGKRIFFLTLPPLTVRAAWVQTAKDVQPASVTWAVMGVIGAGGMSNYDDFFHTSGTVGPDIRGGNKIGYWKISGAS